MEIGHIPVITKWSLALLLVLVLLPCVGPARAQANLDKEFFEAAKRGDAALVRSLLGKEVDVNSTRSGGRTALMEAALEGHTEVARLLLEKGAHVDAKDRDGLTPLMNACERGHVEVAGLLPANGAPLPMHMRVATTPGWVVPIVLGTLCATG